MNRFEFNRGERSESIVVLSNLIERALPEVAEQQGGVPITRPIV